MSKQFRIAVDEENNAENFWDFVNSLSDDGLSQVAPVSVFPLLRKGEEVTVSQADAEELKLWLATLGSMATDGPEYARDPFTFADA